jgi:hypothetical protein
MLAENSSNRAPHSVIYSAFSLIFSPAPIKLLRRTCLIARLKISQNQAILGLSKPLKRPGLDLLPATLKGKRQTVLLLMF